MVIAYATEASWIDSVRAALYALLAYLDDSPRLARFMVVESLAGDPPMLARRARLLDDLSRALESRRPASDTEMSAAPFGADAVVAAVAAILHGRLAEDPISRLRDLGGSLMAVIVLPYLGVDAARGELSRHSTQSETSADIETATDSGVAERLGMRVTFRTFQALDAIAEHPGLSNREVAREAGIGDEGQASRLLSRLSRLGLIESGERSRSGRGSRSWRLTGIGRKVLAEVGLVPADGPDDAGPQRGAGFS